MIFSLTKSLINYFNPFSKTESKTESKNNFIEGYTTIKLVSTNQLKKDGYSLMINPVKNKHKNHSLKIELNKSSNNKFKENTSDKCDKYEMFVLLKNGFKYDINFTNEKDVKGLKPIKIFVPKENNCENKKYEEVNINRLFRDINKLESNNENIEIID
jgi:hypothetical protein